MARKYDICFYDSANNHLFELTNKEIQNIYGGNNLGKWATLTTSAAILLGICGTTVTGTVTAGILWYGASTVIENTVAPTLNNSNISIFWNRVTMYAVFSAGVAVLGHFGNIPISTTPPFNSFKALQSNVTDNGG